MDQTELDQVGIPTVLKEDDTPQPLRINKQTKLPSFGNAGAESIGASELMHTSQHLDQIQMAPSSRSVSLRRSQTQPSLLHRSSTTSSSQSSQGPFSLILQKHRTAAAQRNSASSKPATDALHGNVLGEDQISMVKKNYQSKEKKANMNKGKGPTRAITTGSILSKELPSPFNEGPSIPVASTPSVFQNRPRAMSADEQSEKADFEALGQYPEQSLNKQPSYKRRLFSRVVHSFTSKQNTATGHEQTIRVSSEAAGSYKETHNQSGSEASDKNFISDPCKNTNSEMELVDPLVSFPSPPHPRSASPTEFSSQNPALASVEVRGSPFMAEHVSVVSAEISAIAEVDKLDTEDGQSIFVAVEIRGTLNTPNVRSDRYPELSGLDVVTIIDNSLFASPDTLMASCETARHIGSLLDMAGDRMAIIATSPLQPNGSHSTTVLELGTVNVRKIKLAVDSIVGSSEYPELVTALSHARNLLTEPTDGRQSIEHSQGYFGHVFLITSNCAEVPPDLLHHRRLHIHVVCPGSIPWKSSGSIDNNGWNLRSMHRSELEYINDKKGRDSTSLFNRLRNTILQARGGIITGKLTDLILEITAGSNCSIEGVIGKKQFASLRPGEAITALIKMKVAGSPPSSSPVSLNRQESDPLVNSDNLLDELDIMLGASSFTILTAKLRYNHSLFPSGTKCSIVAESNVRKQTRGSKWDKNTASVEIMKASECKVSVQKRLVFHLATHQSPRNAISALRNQFGDAGDRSVCPRYIKLVMEELSYQARVLERLRSSRISEGVSDTESVSDGPYEHFGEGLFNIPDFKPLEWIPECSDEIEGANAESDEPELVSRYSLVVAPDMDPFFKQPKEKEWMRNTLIADDFSENNTIVEGHSRYVLNAPPEPATKGKFSSSNKEITSSGNQTLNQKNTTRDDHNLVKPQQMYGRGGAARRVLLKEPKNSKAQYQEQHHLKKGKSKENFNPSHESSTKIRYAHGPNRKPSNGENRDDARMIWEDMEDRSRGDSQRQVNTALATDAKVIIAKDEEERIKLLRELDILDQKNMGSDALRSLADRGRTRAEKEWWVRD